MGAISVYINHRYLRFPRKDAIDVIKYVFKSEKKKIPVINVVFTCDKHIKMLNRKFLSHNYSTDVLVFSYLDDSEGDSEIYINLDAARRQAIEYSESYMNEVKRLLIHATLHLIGYTDKIKDEKARMFKIQEKYLKSVCSEK